MERVVHFEIHAANPERAAKFYKEVFNWEIKKWGDMPYWMVMTGEDKDAKWPGINGGMIIRKGEAPKDNQPVNAYVCTVDVDNIDNYIKKVIKEGGKIAVPKSNVQGVGWLVYCKDTEGNIFGMMQAHNKDQM